MRILYLGLSVPDMNKSHHLWIDFILEIHRNGHEINVLAPSGSEDKVGLQMECGVKVLRVPTLKLFNVGFLVKGLANLLLPYQYKRALKKSGWNLSYDIVMMPTPPITLIILATWLKNRYGSKIYVVLRDIFPQNAIDLRIMSKRSPIYAYFRGKEKMMYRNANWLGCMSQGNIDFVIRQNPWIDRKKLHLLPNWRDLMPISKPEKIEAIREKYVLKDKFVVFFGGNIGRPQKIENIIALMEAATEDEDLLFLIVGDGNELPKLEALIRDKDLNNAKVIGRVDSDEYHDLVQACQVGLISLSEDFTIPNIPSKTLSYFNAKKPILASTDIHTDYRAILEESGAGCWVEAGNTTALLKSLKDLKENPAKAQEMGERGYEYMKNNLLTVHAYERFMQQVSSVKH